MDAQFIINDRINFKKPNHTIGQLYQDIYYETFLMEEWKMIYMPYIYVKNYIDIRYFKIINGAYDFYSGLILAENNETMIWLASVFRVSVHCELQDSIIKFPFDKHSCNLEVNYYSHCYIEFNKMNEIFSFCLIHLV